MGLEIEKDDFTWDEGIDKDFFAEIDNPPVVKIEGDDIIVDDVALEDVVDKKVIGEASLFDTIENEEDEDVITDTTVQSKSIDTLNFLKSKGFVDYELEEGEELTEVKAEEIIEDTWDLSIESRIEDLMKDLPDVVKKLNKFALQGGDVQTFLSSITTANNAKISKDLNIEEESNQELLTRTLLEEEGYDTEYIDSQIEYLKDTKKLKMFSSKKFDKWKLDNAAKEEAIFAFQAKQKERDKENKRMMKVNISTFLDTTEDIKGIAFSKKDKAELPNYIADKNVAVEGGGYITSMQRDLFEVLKDSSKTTLLAKLLKTDFDFTSLNETKQTKILKDIRDNVRRSDKVSPASKNGGKDTTKTLADYFND